MPKAMTLLDWWRRSAPAHKRRLAELSQSTYKQIQHYAADGERPRDGTRGVPLLAGLAQVTDEANAEQPGWLPDVPWLDVLPGCAKCPFLPPEHGGKGGCPRGR